MKLCGVIYSLRKGGDRITDREKRFADAYIKSMNATKAYMEVFGEKDRKKAATNASRMKNSSDVSEYIEQALKEISDNAKVDACDMVDLLTAIAFTSPARFAKITTEDGKQKIVWENIENLSEDEKKAIAVIKNTPSGIAIETLDRMKAINLLMKYMGLNMKSDAGVVFEGESELEE